MERPGARVCNPQHAGLAECAWILPHHRHVHPAADCKSALRYISDAVERVPTGAAMPVSGSPSPRPGKIYSCAETLSAAPRRGKARGRDDFHIVRDQIRSALSPARAQGDSPGWSEARRAQPWVTCPQTSSSPVRAKHNSHAGSRSIIRDCPALAGLDFIPAFNPGLHPGLSSRGPSALNQR